MRRSAKIGSHEAFYQYLDAKGMEFVSKDDLAYPDDYQELGAELTVIGEFQSYEENGMTWYHLVNARLA